MSFSPEIPRSGIHNLLPKSLAETSLQILAKMESATEEELMITSALESLVDQCKGQDAESQNQLLI